MRKALLIAAREYNAAVRTKSFVVMVVIMPFLMGGGFIAVKLMEHGADLSDKRLAVIDRSGVVAEAIVAAAETRNTHHIRDPQTGKQAQPAYRVELVKPDDADPQGQRVALSDRVRRKDLLAFVEIDRNVVNPGEGDGRIRYYAENPAMDDMRRWLDAPVNGRIRELRLREAGISEATANRLFSWAPIEGQGLVSLNVQTGTVQSGKPADEGRAIAVPGAMMALMLMMIMIGSSPQVNLVIEEKMQRIAEVMLGSVRPFEFMMGKLLGMLGVSLTVVSIYLAVGVLAARHYGVTDYIPYHLVPWFLVYLVAGIFMYGSIMAGLGAACNDMKEAQSMMMPVVLVIVVPTFVWFNVVREPLGFFATTLSFIPPFTPILMLVRQASPTTIPAWQPWVGLVGMLACTVLSVWVGGRIFRVGLLMQGKPPRLRDLARWAVSG